VFAAALVAWLVALLGDRAVEGVKRVVRGSPEYSALTEAMDLAIGSALQGVPAESRDALDLALRERFAAPPTVVRDGRTRVRTGIVRAIQAQLAPLADAGITPAGKSFLDEIGVDGAQLRDDLANIVIRSIEQVGPAFPALTPLVSQLNADAIVERVDAVLDRISGVQPVAAGSAGAIGDNAARSGHAGRANHPGNGQHSADTIERLAIAFLNIPAVADPEARSTVFAMLPRRLQQAIPHSRYPRIQVLEMIRTCQNYPSGLTALVRAVRLTEGDSPAMAELDQTIMELDGSDDVITDGSGSDDA
jgi:Effector-associated domain 2